MLQWLKLEVKNLRAAKNPAAHPQQRLILDLGANVGTVANLVTPSGGVGQKRNYSANVVARSKSPQKNVLVPETRETHQGDESERTQLVHNPPVRST